MLRSARAILGMGVLAALLPATGPGCAPPCGSAELAPLPADARPRFVVLASDATRTQVSLLDERGDLLRFELASGTESDVWLDERTPLGASRIGRAARLPWSPTGPGWATLLAADPMGTIVRIRLEAAEPRVELTRTEPSASLAPDVEPAVRDVIFAPDAIAAPDDAADSLHDALYVLRGAPIGSPGANEVMVIDVQRDASSGGRIVGRIDLNVDGSAAAPRRMALSEGLLIVGLERARPSVVPGEPPDFAEGAVAIVDPLALRLVATLELPGLRRCVEVARMPEVVEDPDVDHVIVACRGVGESPEEAGASAGIVELAVRPPEGAGHAPSIEPVRTWSARGAPGLLPARGLVALPGHGAAVISAGAADPPRDDVLFVVDLDAGAPPVRVRSAALPLDGSDAIGAGAFDPATGLLAVALGRAGVLRRRVRVGPDGAVAVCPGPSSLCEDADAMLEAPIATCNRLPVRAVARIDDGPAPAPGP